MALNVPVYNEEKFSFGPAIAYVGAAGATPTEDLGFITDDGFTVEVMSEKTVLTQGNPKVPAYVFTNAQSAKVSFTTGEWDFDDFVRILGAGITSAPAGSETISIGGDPLNTKLSLRLVHYMAESGHTLNFDFWTVVSDGGLSFGINQDLHTFKHSYNCLRTTTDWASVTLASGAQLCKFTEITA